MNTEKEVDGAGSFKAYSYYYDAMYVDKDYEFEANWIYSQIVEHSKTKQMLKHLDLGAGTGKHAIRLAQRGVEVTGVELSSEMVSLAPKHEKLSMLQGDLVTFRSDEQFQSCSAMFHVLSYMRNLEEMVDAVKNAASHLESGGVLIFDVWHSPAVSNIGTEIRIKRVSRPGLEIVRLAEPSVLPQARKVSVDYTLFVTEDGGKGYQKVSETHVLRHYDVQEVRMALSEAGMMLLNHFESFTGNPLGSDTWSACYIAAKN